MSRDFIGSAVGRSFKRSPNRDRVTRGTLGYPAAISYITGIPVFVEFFTLTQFTGFLPFINRSYYTRLTSTLEILPAGGSYAGLKTIEVWNYNASQNRMERESFMQDPGWPTNVDSRANVSAYPTFVSPTLAVDQSVLFKRTLELSNRGGDVHSLLDHAAAEFEGLTQFNPSQSNIEITITHYQRLEEAAPRLIGTFATLGPNQGMPLVHAYMVVPTMALPLQNPAYFPLPIIRLQKTRVPVKPGLIWSLKVVDTFTNSGLFPQKQFVTETGCRRTFEEPPDRVYLPDFDAAKTTPGFVLTDYLFGPMAWTQIKTQPPSPDTNVGPSYANYDKPTCYPDIS